MQLGAQRAKTISASVEAGRIHAYLVLGNPRTIIALQKLALAIITHQIRNVKSNCALSKPPRPKAALGESNPLLGNPTIRGRQFSEWNR